MRTSLVTLSAVVLAVFACTASAQQGTRVSAYKALRAAQEQVRPPIKNSIVEIRGEKGTPNPARWQIIFFDPKAGSDKVEVIMRGNEMLEMNEPLDLFSEANPKTVIDLSKFRLDSDKAFKIVQDIATKENNLIASKGNFRLTKIKKDDPKSTPIWIIDVFDAQDNHLGEVTISAFSGAVLRTRKLKHKGEKTPSFGEEVDQTFQEVGDFFTGEDSSKKPDSKR